MFIEDKLCEVRKGARKVNIEQHFWKKVVACVLIIVNGIFCPAHVTDIAASENNAVLSMTDKQLSSISMLNHMTVLSQEINESANSKVYLDNAYSDIVNNINPNAVDSDTMSQIRTLLNTIHAYQSIETKRERLQYIYEQNQANAVKKAIPNPVSVLNVVQSKSPVKALISIVYLAVDSANSYTSYLSEVESKYFQDGWALDDSAADNLHESRGEAFQYMVEMCQKNNLDGKLALNEKAVENFVTWENNPSATRRIDFLEKNLSTYQAYGKYWLVLAESYYEKGEYQKCLDAVSTYEGMHIDTFRKDHDLAKTLAIAIVAADEIQSDSQYVKTANHYLDLMLANIEPEEWMLRYVAAQTALDLYKRSSDKTFLQKAYDLAETNVNYLVDVQHAKNEEYLKDIDKEEIPKDATKDRKNEIKSYNKWLEEERKVALPPVYQPLVLNCDLLFGIADELDISDSQRQKIEDILHSGNENLFFVKQLNDAYFFDTEDVDFEYEIVFTGKKIELPATLLEQGSVLKVIVKDSNKSSIYDDWKIEKVSRKTKGDVNSFVAVYESKAIKKHKYTEDSIVTVEVVPPEESTYDNISSEFKVSKGKKLVVLDDVQFERVK